MSRRHAELICAKYAPEISPAWLSEDLPPQLVSEDAVTVRPFAATALTAGIDRTTSSERSNVVSVDDPKYAKASPAQCVLLLADVLRRLDDLDRKHVEDILVEVAKKPESAQEMAKKLERFLGGLGLADLGDDAALRM